MKNETIKIINNDKIDVILKEDINLIVEINDGTDIHFNCVVNKDINANVLIFNRNEKEITYNDNFDIYGNCKIAYVQLNDMPIVVNSTYRLLEENSSINVRSAIIARCEKTFNINTVHLAKNSFAQIDNYGITDAIGKCELIVTNTINNGTKGCKTHQTSRILTYSATSVGKILPILKIDENDVEASHAASIGKPNQQAIFYLQSRGLTYQEALNLISIGYLLPVSQVVQQEEINKLIVDEIERKVSETCYK